MLDLEFEGEREEKRREEKEIRDIYVREEKRRREKKMKPRLVTIMTLNSFSWLKSPSRLLFVFSVTSA